MNLSKEELQHEEQKLYQTTKVINKEIDTLTNQMCSDKDQAMEFKKYMSQNKSEFDPAELVSLKIVDQLSEYYAEKNTRRITNLYRIQKNPYFGSIIFEEENNREEVYIGITNVNENLKYYVHDWRSPICSLFYDYEIGEASYQAPEGIIKGYLRRKRQYKIKDNKFLHIFDNNINIDDELLQEVLATESDDKMKNIVNTIQQEQNKVIRNTSDQVLVVSGIAGSGKTSVALHRIAFLLYKIPNLTSKDVLIFSPNKIFTEYISNVLPELGESNTLDTTYNQFISKYLEGYPTIESFAKFISNYYRHQVKNIDLIKYKLSDEVIIDMDGYIKELEGKIGFKDSLYLTDELIIDKDELDQMLKNRYQKFPLLERINLMAIKISENNFNGNKTKIKSINRRLLDLLNINLSAEKLYKDFFRNKYPNIIENYNNLKKEITYEDVNIYFYLNCLLKGFPYNNEIKQIIIDEAQDYTYLQYLILSKIFKSSSFTILGDVNQTINPYYHYSSLKNILEIYPNKSKYLELYKTYRSSSKIITYINKILNLDHITAIRRDNNIPVIERDENNNLKSLLIEDVNTIQKNSKSMAIITKTDEEADDIYKLLHSDYPVLEILTDNSIKFKRDFVVIPSYIAKGLEFDSVIVYTKPNNPYSEDEKYLFYVACSRAQHQLIVYNN